MKVKLILVTILFLLSEAILLKHLSPTMNLGDAGEFIASSYTLGVSHPPGYPLYGLIGRIFTLLPLGSIGWRVNLASSIAGVLAIAVIYLIVYLECQSQLLALFPAFLSLSGCLFLEQSLETEIYIFHTALIITLFYLLEQQKISWSLLTFLIGIDFGIHYLILTFIPLFLIEISFTNRPKVNKLHLIFSLSFVFFLGLTCFTYLPLRAYHAPPINWGEAHNFKNLILHLKREQYKVLEFSQIVNYKDKWLFLKEFGQQTKQQYQYLLLLVIPALFSLTTLGKKLWKQLLFFFLAGPGIILLLQFNFEDLNLSRMHAYYLPAFLSLSLIIGKGLANLPHWFPKIPSRKLLISLPIIGLLIFFLTINLKANSHRQDYLGYDFGNNLLSSLPKNAVFFTEGDNKTTPLCYTISVENRRSDLIIFDRSRNLFYDIFEAYRTISRSLRRTSNEEIEKYLVEYYIKSRTVMYSLRPENGRWPLYKISAYGFFYSMLNKDALEISPLQPFRYFNYRFKKNELSYKDYLSLDVVSNYYFHLGEGYIELGEIDKAGDIFVRLSRLGSRLKHIHNNLGVLLKRHGYWSLAIDEFKKSLYLDPNYAESAFNLAQAMEQIDKPQAIKRWYYYLKIAEGNPDETPYIELAHSRLEVLLQTK